RILISHEIKYVIVLLLLSSRRRNTRFKCDWSSDLCSSDLARGDLLRRHAVRRRRRAATSVATLRPPARRHRAARALGAAATRGRDRQSVVKGKNVETGVLSLIIYCVTYTTLMVDTAYECRK